MVLGQIVPSPGVIYITKKSRACLYYFFEILNPVDNTFKPQDNARAGPTSRPNTIEYHIISSENLNLCKVDTYKVV